MPDPVTSLNNAISSLQQGTRLQPNLPNSAPELLSPTANRTLTENDIVPDAITGFTPLEGGAVAPAFGEVIKGAINQVNTAQHTSDEMVEALALGEPVDVHQVMLSLNEASDAMAMTLQVRSHVLKAYQDLMQLPL